VHTSSNGAYIGRLDYATLTPGAARTQAGAMGLYAQSKLGNFLVAREAARRHAGKGVLVNAVHPGGIRTELGRHASPVRRWITVRAWMRRGKARSCGRRAVETLLPRAVRRADAAVRRDGAGRGGR
jgi:NAD(P)-dependent dehydrogenase (short-subunit alcohol dehydrogenase family)